MEKLLPILKPSNYRKDEKFLFKEFLFNSKVSPVIVYGKDMGRMIMYESASNENDFTLKFPKIKEEALSNLKSIEVNYNVTVAEGTKILIVEGYEYASEKILDKDFMKKVASELKSDALMVGVPFKGLLIAIDANSEMRLKLPVIIKQYYENPQQDRISDKVFLVQNGEIVGMGGENLPENEHKDNFVISENKDQNYSIELNSKNIEELTNDLNAAFQQVMLMIMQRKSFGGEITFKLNNSIPKTQSLIDKCHSYIKQIEKNELLQTLSQALTSNKVKFKFLHNGELIAPTSNDIPEANKIDFSKFSIDKLDKEFYRIINMPNARTNVEALITMSELMKEYKKRGIKMPDERKKKTWWKFW